MVRCNPHAGRLALTRGAEPPGRAGMDPITGSEISNDGNSVKAASRKPANAPMARHKADYKPPEHKARLSSGPAKGLRPPTTTNSRRPWPGCVLTQLTGRFQRAGAGGAGERRAQSRAQGVAR